MLLHEGFFVFIACWSALVLFLLFLFYLKEIHIAEGSGKAYDYSYDRDENICSVSNKLLKHGCSCLTQQRYVLNPNHERIYV